jgi:hypothetical protein
MPVLTEAQFKTATRLDAKGLRMGKFRNVRGGKIRLIDNALAAYDQVRHGTNLGQQSQTLSVVLKQCACWLKGKKDKNAGSVNARRAVILQLANDAFMELRRINRASSEDFFNLNKSLTTGAQANYGTKSLSAGYINERKVYVSHGKQQHPPAAGPLHGTLTNLGAVGLPAGFRNAAGQTLMNREWGHLTEADFELLAQIDAAQSGMGAATVYFADKGTRAANLMVVYQGYNNDFENFQGQAYDTQGDPNGHMYAMDEYGTLFASPAAGMAHGNQMWNHSSFNAGKDVICAGMIKIHNGTLVYVDNDSGHYKPTRQHLHGMLTIISNEGINLAGVTVVVKQPAPVANFIDRHTLNAALFVANVNLVDPHAVRTPA